MRGEKTGQGTTVKQYVKEVWPGALVVIMILALEYCV